MDWLIVIGIIIAVINIFGDSDSSSSCEEENSERYSRDWFDNPTRRREAGIFSLATERVCYKCKNYNMCGWCKVHADWPDMCDTCDFFEDRGYDYDYW